MSKEFFTGNNRIEIPSPGVLSSLLTSLYPDRWAESMKLKIDAHPYDLKGYEYTRQILRDKHDHIVIPKAAQMGISIALIILALHRVTLNKWHTLYLMPKKQGAMSFAQGRLNNIMDSNPELASQFKRTDNVRHKVTNDYVNLYLRGTNIVTELREIPVDFEVWDERDKMNEDNLTEALARMDGSRVRKLIEVSTPTAPGHGVDADETWRASDQHRWFVPCPHCNRKQVINFIENVLPWIGERASESEIHCSSCKKVITDEQRWELNTKGEWRPTHLDGEIRGYHISQFNSPTKKMIDIIRPYHEGLTDSSKMRGFYNNCLGEPYAGLGDQITPEMLDACRGNMPLRSIPKGPIYVGVDQGQQLHTFAAYLDNQNRAIAFDMKIFRGWAELEKFLSSLHNFNCVVDGNPEKTKAGELALKFPGKISLAFYAERYAGAEMAIFSNKKRGEVPTVSIDRTMALDNLAQRYGNGNNSNGIMLPADIRTRGEDMPRKDWNGFYQHHLEMVRVEEKDNSNRVVARWKKTRNPDHWHHAMMFMEVAMQKKPSLYINDNILQAFQNAGGVLVG